MTASTINPLTAPPQRVGKRQRTDLTPQQLDALTVYDVVEAAAHMRVSPAKIRAEIHAGRLIAENYGTPARPLYRIPRANLDAWRAAARTAQSSEGK